MARPPAPARRPGRLRARIALAAGAVVVAVLAGPRVVPQHTVVALPVVPQTASGLEAFIAAGERQAGAVRPGAQARIVWADPAHPGPAACAMVYLHGFSASQAEGAPDHTDLARRFSCNLYLARLPGHGLVAPDAMRGLQAQGLVDGAARALAIGHAIGHKVIVIGTSTGGSLALVLAAQRPADIDALVLWSPLIREHDDAMWPLFWPWGRTLEWLLNHRSMIVHRSVASDTWARDIHIDGYRALAQLTRGEMVPALFSQVRQPTFLGYYYRDPAHQDQVVSVPAMLAMFDALGVAAPEKQRVAFADAGTHVIGSGEVSKAAAAVEAASCAFLHRVADLPFAAGVSSCDATPSVRG